MSTIACIRVSAPNEVNVAYSRGRDPELVMRRFAAALQEFSRFGIGFPVGFIFEWPGNAPPPGCLICDGSAVGRGTFPELFRVIGERFGPGDGSTTFNIPTQEQARQARPEEELPTQQIEGGAVVVTNPDGTTEPPVVTGGRPPMPPGRTFPNTLP